MALTFTNVTTASSTVSSATLTASSLTISAEQWVVVAVAADNSGTGGIASLTGVTDSAGNSYQQLCLNNRNVGGAGTGTTLGIYLAKINDALSSGSISANFSPNTPIKAMSIKRISVSEGETFSVFAVGPGVVGSSSAPSSGAVSVSNRHTIYGALAFETESLNAETPRPDVDTANGSWSAQHTVNPVASSAGQCITTQQKTVTATGNQTYNIGLEDASDYALNYVIFAPSVLGYWAINGVTQ